jgi:hypothetical protein
VTAIEGVPVVKLARAIQQCAAAHLGGDLLEQALRHGRARGLLSSSEHDQLARELGLQDSGERA